MAYLVVVVQVCFIQWGDAECEPGYDEGARWIGRRVLEGLLESTPIRTEEELDEPMAFEPCGCDRVQNPSTKVVTVGTRRRKDSVGDGGRGPRE
jgi:hypothetical protein